MEWNLFEDTRIVRRGGQLSLLVGRVELKSGARPKGVEINPDLATGSKGRIFQEFLASSVDGEFYIGPIRPGVGGAFVIPFSQVDLGDDAGRIVANLESKYGKTAQALIAVVRGEDAPGTHGCVDGGGAGIPEIILDSPKVIQRECLKENLGEISIESKTGRISFMWAGIDSFVKEEWETSWGEVPPTTWWVPVDILPAPDKVVIAGQEATNVALAFEIKNASVEILQLHSLTIPPGEKFRFRDLEHRPSGEKLNRLIAAVCQGSEKLFAIFFDGGRYSERIPSIPLTGDCLSICANAKCRRFLSLLGWI